MPNLKDIKDRINSITSTQKITKAMKMVAAAKVKKSENIVKAGRPFAQEMRNMFIRLWLRYWGCSWCGCNCMEQPRAMCLLHWILKILLRI